MLPDFQQTSYRKNHSKNKSTIDRLADAAAPGGASLEVIGLVMLVGAPTNVPVILTEIVHDAFGAKVPPDRVMLFDPELAVTVPPHELDRALGDATNSPPGSTSVKARPVSGLGFTVGLVIVKLKVVLLPTPNN